MTAEQIIRLPYETYGKGVYAVNLTGPNGEILPFLVDTGATQSALFDSAVGKIGLKTSASETVTIHGMVDQKVEPIVYIPALNVGSRTYKNHKMAVLSDRGGALEKRIRPSGLLGMDILADYRVFVNARDKTFNLIPKDIARPLIPTDWRYIPLMTNPFIEDNRDLHFLEIRVGNHLLPALLDTGSEANIMNWSVSKFPRLRKVRTNIYNSWQLNGAIGTFEPVSKINVKNFRAGQKFWYSREFLVMDFENLEIIGIKDQPFVIAGADLLADSTFYLDFETDELRIKPGRDEEENPKYKGADIFVVDGPRARN